MERRERVGAGSGRSFGRPLGQGGAGQREPGRGRSRGLAGWEDGRRRLRRRRRWLGREGGERRWVGSVGARAGWAGGRAAASETKKTVGGWGGAGWRGRADREVARAGWAGGRAATSEMKKTMAGWAGGTAIASETEKTVRGDEMGDGANVAAERERTRGEGGRAGSLGGRFERYCDATCWDGTSLSAADAGGLARGISVTSSLHFGRLR